MTRSRVKKEIERVYNEVQEFVEEIKDPRERINFKRKQLKFLKAEVHHPKIPFRRCMLSQTRKKERRANSVKRKLEIGLNRVRK